LICDTHPVFDITGYSKALKKFVCSQCALPADKKQIIPITREKAEEVYTNLVG
jgi:hypothetical protein